MRLRQKHKAACYLWVRIGKQRKGKPVQVVLLLIS